MASFQIVQSPGARRCQGAILPRRRGKKNQKETAKEREKKRKKPEGLFWITIKWVLRSNVVKQDQEYLKPSVVHALANAELYCLALAHIYADPNYSQLNHWGVIQALARKGVYVAEPSDVALTETTLIHTSPLRMVIKLHSIHF